MYPIGGYGKPAQIECIYLYNGIISQDELIVSTTDINSLSILRTQLIHRSVEYTESGTRQHREYLDITVPAEQNGLP